jgi:cytochrome c
MRAIHGRALFAAAAALAALIAAQAPQVRAATPELTPPEQVELGRRLAERNCGMCHGLGPSALSRDPQAPPFRQLNRRMNVDDLGEGLAARLLVTHPAMPQFRFDPHEVVAIVRYLRSVQVKPRA